MAAMPNAPARPPRVGDPLFTTSNGIYLLAISETNENYMEHGGHALVPLAENTWAFTTMTSALNTGLLLLETNTGRQELVNLGNQLVEDAPYDRQNLIFPGGVRRMPMLVDHFLYAIRHDFPYVDIVDLGPADIMARALRRNLGWNGDLLNYDPKGAITIEFNHRRVRDMVQAYMDLDEMDRNFGTTAQQRASQVAMTKRFQFMFALTALHELTHAFIGYLHHERDPNILAAQTPPHVSHLDYGRPDAVYPRGESGRWIKNQLFGGAIEYYRSIGGGDRQPGMAFIVDVNNVAWEVHEDSIFGIVEHRSALVFPLRTFGPGITRPQRLELEFRTMGDDGLQDMYVADYLWMRAQELPLGRSLSAPKGDVGVTLAKEEDDQSQDIADH